MDSSPAKRLLLQLPESLVEEVEAFRRSQGREISVSEAAQKLIALGLLTWLTDTAPKKGSR